MRLKGYERKKTTRGSFFSSMKYSLAELMIPVKREIT